MAGNFTLTEDDLKRAKIVLTDALPYELNMLDVAARYMKMTEFSKLRTPTNEIECHTYNATIESFWTHARCLIEFFNRPENNNFQSSAASARDFTDGFYPSSDMQKLSGSGSLSEKINEQVSHVGFCRKAETYEKLGAVEMVRVKSIINKEVQGFEQKLKREFQPFLEAAQNGADHAQTVERQRVVHGHHKHCLCENFVARDSPVGRRRDAVAAPARPARRMLVRKIGRIEHPVALDRLDRDAMQLAVADVRSAAEEATREDATTAFAKSWRRE
jgi:hypothetical protein